MPLPRDAASVSLQTASQTPAPAKPKTGPQKALAKLGLTRRTEIVRWVLGSPPNW